jgi:hypothetical protein
LSNIKLGKIIEKILGKKDETRNKERTSGHSTVSAASYPVSPGVSARPERIYIKARVLQSIEDLNSVKDEVIAGNIIIVRLGPLAEKSTDNVNKAVSELYDFVKQIGGDIAQLGEERIIVTPSFVEIWREKST